MVSVIFLEFEMAGETEISFLSELEQFARASNVVSHDKLVTLRRVVATGKDRNYRIPAPNPCYLSVCGHEADY